MSKDFNENFHQLIKDKFIKVVRESRGGYYVLIESKDNIIREYPLYSNELKIALKKLYLEHFDKILFSAQIQIILEMLEVMDDENTEEIEFFKRIFNDGYQYAYELNREDVVWIEKGKVFIATVKELFFKHPVNFMNQVEPNLNIKPERLLYYMHKHFNMKSDKDIKLLMLFLVTSFWGLNINHPILVLKGEKGSAKSTTLRKLEKLIDPKSSDLGGGIPRGNDGLELRLSNSYFAAFDNLSSLSRRVSDILAVSATGGSVTKRALYKNTEEIILDLKAVVAINGVSLVAKESDLLDRALIITLKRIDSKEIITEQELWEEFEKDRANILGCCFQTLAIALNDKRKIKTQEKIRMADFHVSCIKVGRALGIEEEEVSEILWENQKNVNKHTLDEDIVALCVIELMKNKKTYTNSVSGLLCDLLNIVDDNGMPSTVLPKTPNHLSNRLYKVQSNLQSECGIVFHIKNVGTFKEIYIKNIKNLRK